MQKKLTISEIHQNLVPCICALEEYVNKDEDCSPIVEVIAMALRKNLDEIEGSI